jgi:hypothetical protein
MNMRSLIPPGSVALLLMLSAAAPAAPSAGAGIGTAAAQSSAVDPSSPAAAPHPAAAPSAPAQVAPAARPPGGRFSLHPYFGLTTGGWSKTEPSTAGDGQQFRYEFSNGAGAGLRAGFAVMRHVGIWAAAELNVEQEGPFAGVFGGVSAHALLAPRLGVHGRLGAGRLEDGPFGLAGVGIEWFVLRSVTLGIGGDLLRPIGTGSRNNGLRDVDVDYSGGPTRFQVELGWYPGR